MHQIVVDSISRTDLDLRKDLYSNIVLSGGSTLTKGFGDRLLTEVQKLAVKDMRIKIYAPPERKYSTWIGGSILAGLSTFRKASLSCGEIAVPARKTHAHRERKTQELLLTCTHRCGLVSTTGMRIPTSFTPSLLKFLSIQHIVNPAAEYLAAAERFNGCFRILWLRFSGGHGDRSASSSNPFCKTRLRFGTPLPT